MKRKDLLKAEATTIKMFPFLYNRTLPLNGYRMTQTDLPDSIQFQSSML